VLKLTGSFPKISQQYEFPVVSEALFGQGASRNLTASEGFDGVHPKLSMVLIFEYSLIELFAYL
jgi:hypothetical protein